MNERWPAGPIVFCDTRKHAQAWPYRFLAAASAAAPDEHPAGRFVADLAHPPPLAPAPPSPAEVRAWAVGRGSDVSSRGRVPSRLVAAYLDDRDG